ncbi:purine-cytosine permease family protein [Acidisoma sp. 7E03]
MESDVLSNHDRLIEADRVGRIETHGVDPIPLADRHGTPWELFRMWIGANVNYIVVVTGALVLAEGLSFWQAITAVMVGNLLGCTVLGLATIMGPRTGTSGIMTSRSCFGQLGSFMPKAVSLISALSWFSINSLVATDALTALLKMVGAHGDALPWISLVIILAGEVALAAYGHATIIVSEKWMAVVLAVLFAGLAYFVLSKSHLASITSFNSAGGNVSEWLIGMGIAFAYPLGWANFASDYSRYLPPDTSWKRIAFAAGGGQFLALVLCEIIGILFAAALGGNLGYDPVSQLSHFLPAWFIVPLLLAVILGGIGANVPNGYTASLGLIAMRLPINRLTSLAVITLFTVAVRVVTVLNGQFYDLYELFLGYMVYWTAPWAAIVIVDYFMRDGRYDSADWMPWKESAYWYTGGVFLPGVIAFVVGTAASLAFSNSPTFASPLMKTYLGWGDLSFEVGLVSAGLIYFFLARGALSRQSASPRHVGEAPGARLPAA